MNIDASFEKISKYEADQGVIIPGRKTKESAGYDFYAAEDTVIQPYNDIVMGTLGNQIGQQAKSDFETYEEWLASMPYTLEQIADLTKKLSAKVTLVPTGIKCHIPDGYYLQLSVRSSLPLKHWLVMANGVGIIDADYYNNPDNEGHIYFQLINLLPVPVVIKKGECFGQGILLPYGICSGESGVTAERAGGFGSTSA